MVKKRQLSAFRVIILGFMAIILIGSILLTLPFATRDGNGASFSDALFTSTSATCVTGLIVQDTATYWSLFGQIVIITLIQIGGLGVVTTASVIALISGKKIGFVSRNVMQESISAPQVGGIVKLTQFSIIVTILVEFIGFLLMLPIFIGDHGFAKGAWYAFFHAVSAFCNAGFDLMGVEEPFSSLTSFNDNIIINIVIMMLIIIGGLGFLTWDDIRVNKFHFKKYRMQSKVIFTVTGLLIFIPALYFFFIEFSDPKWNMTLGERILSSLFQSVTARTAGFNTVDHSMMRGGSLVIMVILMLIGGSPGSTAGGMKTTTIAVLFSSSISVFRRKNQTVFFGRSIPDGSVNHASAVMLMYITIFITAAVAISEIDNLPIRDCFYETSSAIATVGLTLGITTKLSTASRFILIILMFIGRVGGLTLIYAAMSNHNHNISKLPQEKIILG